jgi:hypothetical protein
LKGINHYFSFRLAFRRIKDFTPKYNVKTSAQRVAKVNNNTTKTSSPLIRVNNKTKE